VKLDFFTVENRGR